MRLLQNVKVVTPAEAESRNRRWIPAFAGMTVQV